MAVERRGGWGAALGAIVFPSEAVRGRIVPIGKGAYYLGCAESPEPFLQIERIENELRFLLSLRRRHALARLLLPIRDKIARHGHATLFSLAMLGLGWLIQPPGYAPAPTEPYTWARIGPPPPIVFSSAVKPVTLHRVADDLCRSHRGLQRNENISVLPRCDGLIRSRIVRRH